MPTSSSATSSGAAAPVGRVARRRADARERHRDRLAPEDGRDRQQAEHGQQDERRELGGEGRAEGRARGQRGAPGRALGRALEGDDGQEDEERRAEVGGDDLAVGQHVRAQHAEEAAPSAAAGRPQCRRVQANTPAASTQAEQRRWPCGRGGTACRRRSSGRGTACRTPTAGAAARPRRPGFMRDVRRTASGAAARSFDERRVLGVQPVVAQRQVRVAGGQVRALVEGRRSSPRMLVSASAR